MALDTAEHIYKEIADNKEEAEKARDLLKCQDWYLNLFDFDPVTGEALPSDLDALLVRISIAEEKKKEVGYKYFPNDRIQNIVNYISSAVSNLFDVIHEKHIREHLVTNAQKVRETDSKALRYLSRKPGRTVRQKIAVDQKMMGVFHDTSIDTAENRVLKALLYKLDYILFAKEKAFGLKSMTEDQQVFNSRIHRWLNSEEAQCIRDWTNLPPNNTLLNDINYRKIWKAFNNLNNIDLDFAEDLKNLSQLKKQIEFFNNIASLNLNKNVNFNQQPVFLELSSEDTKVSSLKIKTLFAKLYCQIKDEKTNEKTLFKLEFNNAAAIPPEFKKYLEAAKNLKPKNSRLEATEKAIVDITQLVPFINKADCDKSKLRMQLKYQIWKGNDSKTEYMVPAFYSNYLSKADNESHFEYTIKDYFDSDLGEEDTVEINHLVKLAPYFAKEVAWNLNTRNCTYLIPDDVDDFSIIQKALRFSLNIAFQNAAPLPRSIACIFNEAQKGKYKAGDVIYVYDKYEKRTVITKISVSEDKRLLELNPQTRGLIFERSPSDVIDARERYNKSVANAQIVEIKERENITGGVEYLERLQAITPDIPLWKDKLPLLYMEVEVDDEQRKVYLVGKDTKPIYPKRGVARNIEITDSFILSAGRDFYEFPLVQGAKEKKQKYFAYMTDKSFPLKKDVTCKLYLTYTYGEPLPYKLIFRPCDGSVDFEAIKVQWETKTHKDLSASAPEFYQEESWEEVLAKELKMGTVSEELYYTLSSVENVSNNNWQRYIVNNDKSNFTYKIACVLEAFNQGRTLSQITDDDIAADYYDYVAKMNEYGEIILNNRECPRTLKQDILVLLCALHEHSSSYVHKYLLKKINATLQDKNSEDSLVRSKRIIDGIGYAIGNCNKDWQKELLDKAALLCKNRDPMLKNFGIEILGSALWRTRNCVYKLAGEQIKVLISTVVDNISNFADEYVDVKTQIVRLLDPDYAKKNWRKRVTLLRSIELLLALYRLRDPKAPNYKKAEQFVAENYAEIKRLKKAFPKLEEFFRFETNNNGASFGKEKYKALRSRIIFEIEDNNRDLTIPDFMYVLEKYTRGDTLGIKILKVTE